MPFFFRHDGDRVHGLSYVRRMMPFLMPTVSESLVYFEQKLDLAKADAFLADFKQRTGLRATYLHLLAWALVRTLAARPRLNRFLAGPRIYQRRGIWISFSGKKAKTDDHPLITIKRRLDPEMGLEEIVRSLDGEISDQRAARETATETELKWLLRIPDWILGPLVRLVKLLDRWNLLPAFFIDSDPMFASVFVANLGSINLEAAYHHLFEYGNIPVFVVIGKAGDEVVAIDGQPQVRRQLTLRYTLDERVEDGLYCVQSLEQLRRMFEDPAAA